MRSRKCTPGNVWVVVSLLDLHFIAAAKFHHYFIIEVSLFSTFFSRLFYKKLIKLTYLIPLISSFVPATIGLQKNICPSCVNKIKNADDQKCV